MKFTAMAKTVAFLMSLLSWAKVPIDAENQEITLTAEQRQKIVDALGEKDADAAIKGINSEIKGLAANNLQLKAIQDEIAAMVLETNMTAEELNLLAEENGGGPKNVMAQLQAIKAKQVEQASLIAKLISEPEGDKPTHVIPGANTGAKVAHSATHLYASNHGFDAFADRPWNQRAAGQVSAVTDFTSQPTIQKLNDDLDLYFRQNPEAIKSLHRDTFGLPDFWQKRTKVDDKVADGNIATAEVTQGRKLPWLPKNKQLIKAEEGQIFPVQIDIEFVGYYLQRIEASWLNMMNKEGSQPYKDSFVKFLVSELDKKARQEDRIATIKGVYVETPEDATFPGRSINRQNGLLYLAQQARDVTKKYRPFDLGMPTTTNIVDYVDNFIKALPYDVRNQQGLVLYLSQYWIQAYKRRYEQLHGVYNDYDGYPENPKDYANVRFEPLIDMEGSDFIFMTFDDNIEILENVPAEKSMYHFEYLKRIIYIWADYKMGVRFIHIGSPVVEGDPLEFSAQTLWSNTVPVFPKDFFIPIHDDETGKVKVNYKNLYVAKNWKTDITEFTNTTPGTILKVKGDTTLANAENIVDGAKIELVGNASFNLKSGGTITFLVKENNVVKELSRTTAPDTTVVPDVSFTTTTVDANAGLVFRYAGVADASMTQILNGVEGKSIKIYGTDAVGIELTFTVTGNINCAAVLADSVSFVQLTLVDGVWFETDRLITA